MEAPHYYFSIEDESEGLRAFYEVISDDPSSGRAAIPALYGVLHKYSVHTPYTAKNGLPKTTVTGYLRMIMQAVLKRLRALCNNNNSDPGSRPRREAHARQGVLPLRCFYARTRREGPKRAPLANSQRLAHAALPKQS